MRISKITIIILLVVAFVGKVWAGTGDLKAGFGVRVVNPNEPAVPIGHVGTTPRSNIHADLRVQAMVLEDNAGKRIVWMGWDFCNVLAPVADKVKKLVEQKYGIAPEAFCINASHTHSAPPLMKSEAVKPEFFDADYAGFVVAQAVQVVGDAIGDLSAVKLRYSEYPATSVGVNRRMKIDDGVAMIPNPAGVVDHRVQIIAAESLKDKQLKGLIVKYACHPVTVGPTGIGSDYPGFMRRFIEKRHTGAVAVFLQGCGGNIRIQIVDEYATKFIRENQEQVAAKLGRDLGMSVEWALNKPGLSVAGPIEYKYEVIELPLAKVPESKYRKEANGDTYRKPWGEKFLAMLERGEKIPQTQPYRIQAFHLGADSKNPFILIALQGEVFTEYAFNLADRLKPANTIVLGYSNHIAGYVCTAEAIKQGGYEPNAYPFWKQLPGPYTTEVEAMILEAATKAAKSKTK